ncbi:MAG: hypothetical protein JXA42_08590 [Anaerolineales bacterium]|nr:hypothetical protein [Anaerolineales bacterium]
MYQRGSAYLEAEKYSAALDDFENVQELTDSSFQVDCFFIYQGLCHWCLNNFTQVLPVWERGLNAPYTDAAGGVVLPALMLYGAERLKDEDYMGLGIRLLKEHDRKGNRNWPGAIVPFLLGKSNKSSLISASKKTTSDILASRWKCQADFYIALVNLCKGAWRRFKGHMKQCVDNPYGYHECEYYLARWERENGFSKSIK